MDKKVRKSVCVVLSLRIWNNLLWQQQKIKQPCRFPSEAGAEANTPIPVSEGLFYASVGGQVVITQAQ